MSNDVSFPTDLETANREIVGYRAEIERLQEMLEQCARVAETLVRQGRNGYAIANAIRALKSNTSG